jgi:hypothetical protein
VTVVSLVFNIAVATLIIKGRPATARIKLMLRIEQLCPTASTVIITKRFIVQQLSSKWPFGAFFAAHAKFFVS